MKFIYQYNNFGKLIKIHFNFKEASINTKIPESTIRVAVKRVQLVRGVFYFSNNKNFKLPEFRKNNYEPIFAANLIFGDGKKILDMWQPWKENKRKYIKRVTNLN